MGKLSTGTDTVRAIAAEFSAKNVSFMAAGIAYNAFLSLAPILVVFLVVVSAVGGGLEERVVELSQESFPGPIADIVAEVFQGGSGDPAASLIGVVVLLWGTLKIFRGLDTAFSEIYETAGENSFLDQLVDGGIVFVALVVAIVATIGVTTLFAALAIPFIGLLTPVLLLAGLVVAFVPMYYRFPDADVELRDVLPGAILAAVGWSAFQSVFQVYLAFSGDGSDSLFGGVIVVITWLYFSGLVLLLGAVTNAVLGGHTSGTEGGVGRGAGGYETRREEQLDPGQFRGYLRDLGAGMSVGNSESGDQSDRYLRPEGEITVIEQSNSGDKEEMAIGFRWHGKNKSKKQSSEPRRQLPADD
jgi:membrane protein